MSKTNSFTKIQCQIGFNGPYCTPICFGKNTSDFNICSNRGICSSPENCICSNGYTGNECQINICYGKNSSDVCSGHGNCSLPDICNCTQGYVGNDCQLTICYGKNSSDSKVCSGQGNCTSPNNCKCSTGYQGSNCEQRIILWDLISTLCTSGCSLNKTFWQDCLLVKGASCYCNYTSKDVNINCSSIDVTHM
jgi:hypothetical protein